MKSIYLASGNQGKVREIRQFFSAADRLCHEFEVKGLDDLPSSIVEKFNPVEDGHTFRENSYIKANSLFKLLEEDAFILADDSGLEVEKLNNYPGVHSARYADSNANRIKRLLRELEEQGAKPYKVDDVYCLSQAKFRICFCLLDVLKNPIYFLGKVSGHILANPVGSEGFGYDPIFYYPPYKKTFAACSMQEKSAVSHRGLALENIARYLLSINLPFS